VKGAQRKKINLALQGGGAHGAFTWGVLDHLLSDDRVEIEGISGASAGAVNAVVLTDGLARGGREEARSRLAAFWRAMSRDGNLSAAQRTVLDRLFWFLPTGGSPVQAWFEMFSKYVSPYDVNPLNINPLRELIERFVDFEAVRACPNPLFVSATNVNTGKLRVFPREKITVDVVAASACLPQVFRAVEIDGVPYWDGGYMGNPTLFPLFRATESEDVVIVQINPVERSGTPTSSREIMNRINEITFNSSLMGELRAIEFVARLIEEGKLPHGRGSNQYRHINVHRIALGHAEGVDAGSKLNNDFDFFQMLHRMGVRAARRFLDAHYDEIGHRSSIDLKAEVRAERG
jgi:NTE family protein